MTLHTPNSHVDMLLQFAMQAASNRLLSSSLLKAVRRREKLQAEHHNVFESHPLR